MTAQQWLELNAVPIPEAGCWLFQGAASGGYGAMNVRGLPRKAHRTSWSLFNGPIPAGLCVCHRCDVPLCVNPKHLFLGTKRDNVVDMYQKGRRQHVRKTHCPQGHELVRPSWCSHGICPTCRRASLERLYERRRLNSTNHRGIT